MDTVESRAVESNIVESNAVQSDTMESRAVQSDRVESRVVQSDTMEPRAVQSDIVESGAVKDMGAFVKNSASAAHADMRSLVVNHRHWDHKQCNLRQWNPESSSI